LIVGVIVIPKRYIKCPRSDDKLSVKRISDVTTLKEFNRENLIREFDKIKLYTSNNMKKADAEMGKRIYREVLKIET